jgi:hypothetical protein
MNYHLYFIIYSLILLYVAMLMQKCLLARVNKYSKQLFCERSISKYTDIFNSFDLCLKIITTVSQRDY